MGGVGGRYFEKKPDEVIRQLRKTERLTQSHAFLAQVEELLGGILGQANRRDQDALGNDIDVITRSIQSDFVTSLTLKFGGSLAKHTYVDGLSDVDILVIIDDCILSADKPTALKDRLEGLVRFGVPDMDIHKGKLAITLKSKSNEIQLIPAVRCESHLKISDSAGEEWVVIDPEKFAAKLVKINEESRFKVIPVIKLVKSILSSFPPRQQLKSYHIEALAIEIFQQMVGGTPREMLEAFFEKARDLVLRPINEITGQSEYVDEYLGNSNGLERLIRRDMLDRIYRRMKNADSSSQIEEWMQITGTNVQ